MKQVGKVWLAFAGMVLAVAGGGWSWLGAGERFYGLIFGLGLFAGNFALLTLLGRQLFGSQGAGAGVSILFGLKIGFLGFGAYVGLALLRLPALWFVVGVVIGLVLVTVASASPFRRVPGEP